jgi:UDP-N-acetyl-2-amino-2-deoxyglucuronate dehydrogenase
MTTHIGIIGGGNISETHARAARAIPGVEIAAVFGHNREKIDRLAKTYGGAPYTDFAAFLAHKPMEMVAIGSPSGLHSEQGIAAARAGLHILTEKPIDISTARADALIAAADQADVRLGVFFQDRFKPDLQRVKSLLDAGILGKPILGEARVKWWRPPEYYAGSKWRGTLALDGGGALINQGVHTVDLLLWLWGDVTAVQAKMSASLHKIEAEDTLVALLEFANGAFGTLIATTSVFPGYPRRVELTGSEGTLAIEQDLLVRADLHKPDPSLIHNEPGDQDVRAASAAVNDIRGHQAALEDFLRAIRTHSRPACDGREARRSVALVEAIYAAARTAQRVIVPR